MPVAVVVPLASLESAAVVGPCFPAPWAETPSLYRVLARRVCLRARPSLIIPCV